MMMGVIKEPRGAVHIQIAGRISFIFPNMLAWVTWPILTWTLVLFHMRPSSTATISWQELVWLLICLVSFRHTHQLRLGKDSRLSGLTLRVSAAKMRLNQVNQRWKVWPFPCLTASSVFLNELLVQIRPSEAPGFWLLHCRSACRLFPLGC